MLMNSPLTKRFINHSDKESFSFSFLCDECGKKWTSPPAAFISLGFTAIEHEEAWNLIWAEEHRQAFEKANLRAHMHFNNCPKCGRWVCDECFDVKGEHCKKCMSK